MRSRASPMTMTVARRAASGPARSAKSPPLKRPPRMTTSPSPKLSMARRAASMLVAFESFTNCTPAMSATGSSACSSPVNPSTAAVMAAGLTPAMCATAVAAITSTSRWRPSSRIDVSGTNGSEVPSRRLTIALLVEHDAVGELLGHRQHQPPCMRVARDGKRRGIVGVEHRPVGHGLVLEDPCLRGRVLVDRRVAIEVVGRKVQEHGDPGMKRLDPFELEAARLDDVNRLGGRGLDLRAQCVADVAADQDLVAAGLEHAAGQRRGGRLALGAGDRDDPSGQPARCQLELANDLGAAAARRFDDRLIPRHAGAQHDQVRCRKRLRRVSADLERNARRFQIGRFGE